MAIVHTVHYGTKTLLPAQVGEGQCQDYAVARNVVERGRVCVKVKVLTGREALVSGRQYGVIGKVERGTGLKLFWGI